jgi:hypothetical protein
MKHSVMDILTVTDEQIKEARKALEKNKEEGYILEAKLSRLEQHRADQKERASGYRLRESQDWRGSLPRY